jgi:predicted ATP-grasp superfamily ATP-dependent carboligase
MKKKVIDVGVENYIEIQRHKDFRSWILIIIMLIVAQIYMLNKQTEEYNEKLLKFKMDYALLIAKKDKMFMDSLIRFADDNVIEKNIIK